MSIILTETQNNRMYNYLDSILISKKSGREYHFDNEENIPESERKIVKYLAAVRHQLHRSGTNIFFNNTKASDEAIQIKRFLFSLSANEVFRNNSIPFPYEICQQYRHIGRFDTFVSEHPDFTRSQFMDVAEAFHYDNEHLNDAFERFFQKVDEKYGTSFTPKHCLRNLSKGKTLSDEDTSERLKEKTVSKIIKYYEENFGSLPSEIDCIPEFESIEPKIEEQISHARIK